MENSNKSYCEISAWCPVERDEGLSKTLPVLKDTEKFTVYIKNSISFPYFGPEFHRSNIIGGRGPSFYHQKNNPLGQIFYIGEVVRLAGGNYSTLAIRGGVIGIRYCHLCVLYPHVWLYCEKSVFGCTIY